MPRILLFTGNGKGKTTAALGMAVRALGHDMRVLAVHFVKEDTSVGEHRFLQKHPRAEVVYTGAGFLPSAKSSAFAKHKEAARAGLESVRAAFEEERHDLYILDELAFAVARGLLPVRAVLETLARAPEKACVVLTGRDAPPELAELADTVTEMRCLKHGAEAGIPAQDGVER